MSSRNFKQGIIAVFGQPVAENPTQVMIEAAFAAMGLDWRYLTLEWRPPTLAVPLPERAPWASMVSTAPSRTRSLSSRDGRLIGENTDGKGFLLSLPHPPNSQNVVILGAGGAARAIAVELALAGGRPHNHRQPRPDPRPGACRPAYG